MPTPELQPSITLPPSEQKAIKWFVKYSLSNPPPCKLFNRDAYICSAPCSSNSAKSKKIIGETSQSSIFKKIIRTGLLDMVNASSTMTQIFRFCAMILVNILLLISFECDELFLLQFSENEVQHPYPPHFLFEVQSHL